MNDGRVVFTCLLLRFAFHRAFPSIFELKVSSPRSADSSCLSILGGARAQLLNVASDLHVKCLHRFDGIYLHVFTGLIKLTRGRRRRNDSSVATSRVNPRTALYSFSRFLFPVYSHFPPRCLAFRRREFRYLLIYRACNLLLLLASSSRRHCLQFPCLL